MEHSAWCLYMSCPPFPPPHMLANPRTPRQKGGFIPCSDLVHVNNGAPQDLPCLSASYTAAASSRECRLCTAPDRLTRPLAARARMVGRSSLARAPYDPTMLICSCRPARGAHSQPWSPCKAVFI